MGTFWSSSSSPSDEHIGIYDHVHCRQERDWDCGVACFLMALRFIKSHNAAVTGSPSETRSLQPFYEKSTPLWTIDIYVALKDCGVANSAMYTTSIGIDPKHRENSWYSSHIDSDVERIMSKFKRAAEEQWIVQQVRFDLAQFCTQKLRQSGGKLAAIILVCSNTMRCHPRKAEKYAGHYLFLVDYDDLTEEALYLDPSLVSTEAQRVALSTLEAAFSEPGTDHDIIVINNS